MYQNTIFFDFDPPQKKTSFDANPLRNHTVRVDLCLDPNNVINLFYPAPNPACFLWPKLLCNNKPTPHFLLKLFVF